MKNTQDNISRLSSSTGIWIAVTILLGSVSLFFSLHGPYVNSKAFIIYICAAICTLLYLYKNPFQNTKNLFKLPIVWGIGVFILLLIITSSTSIDPTLSWFGIPVRATSTLFLIVVSIFSLVIGSTFSKEEIKKYVFIPISISGVLIALSVLLERAGWSFLASADGGGLLGNTSYVGTYLLISLFTTIYLITTSKGRERLLYIFLLAATVLNPIFINFSFSYSKGLFDIVGDARGATVAVVVGLSVGLIALLITSTRSLLRTLGKGLVLIFIGVSVFLLIQIVTPTSTLRTKFVQQTNGTRFIYWNIALKGFKAHSLVGTGPETYVYTYQTYFNPDVYLYRNNSEIWTDKPHNVYIETLSTGGIVGAIGYLVFLIGIFYSIYLGYRSSKDRWYLSTMLGLFAAYMVNNIFIFDTPTSYLLLFSIIGAVIVHAKKDVTVQKFKHEYQRTIQVSVGIFLVLILSIFIVPQIIKMHRIRTDTKLNYVQRIPRYSDTEYMSSYGSSMSLSQRIDRMYEEELAPNMQYLVKETSAHKAVVIKAIDVSVNILEDLFSKYPENIQGLVAIGKVEGFKIAIQGEADQESLNIMQHSAQDAISLAPSNPAGYWVLGQFYVYQKQYDDAYRVYEQARAIDPEIAQSHYNLIALAQNLHDEKKAQFFIQRANEESSDYKNNLIPN